MIDFDRALQEAIQRNNDRQAERRHRAVARRELLTRMRDRACIGCGCDEAPHQYIDGGLTYHLCEACERA